jgi:hypothetical protein
MNKRRFQAHFPSNHEIIKTKCLKGREPIHLLPRVDRPTENVEASGNVQPPPQPLWKAAGGSAGVRKACT